MIGYITVKLSDGTYKNVEFDNIKQVFVSVKGEKIVFFTCNNKLEYGTEIEEGK